MAECVFRLIAKSMLSQMRLDNGEWINTECPMSGCQQWDFRMNQCGLLHGNTHEPVLEEDDHRP